jgi:hypothetical protein
MLETKIGCLDSSYVCGATQIEAAIMQLDTAASLFFADNDLLSTYTLARNANEILSVFLEKKGHKPLWQAFIDSVEPDHRKQFLGFYNRPRNALKHNINPKDENALILFSRESLEWFLFFGVNAVHIMRPNELKERLNLGVYNLWFRIHYPNVLKKEERMAMLPLLISTKLSKKEFYAVAQKALEDTHINYGQYATT